MRSTKTGLSGKQKITTPLHPSPLPNTCILGTDNHTSKCSLVQVAFMQKKCCAEKDIFNYIKL